MKMTEMIETMREIVSAYDKIEEKKRMVKMKTQAMVKGGIGMKFKTIIGIAAGAVLVIAIIGATLCMLKKAGKCKCACRKKEDENLYDDFPEEAAEEAPETEEAPEEEPEAAPEEDAE